MKSHLRVTAHGLRIHQFQPLFIAFEGPQLSKERSRLTILRQSANAMAVWASTPRNHEELFRPHRAGGGLRTTMGRQTKKRNENYNTIIFNHQKEKYNTHLHKHRKTRGSKMVAIYFHAHFFFFIVAPRQTHAFAFRGLKPLSRPTNIIDIDTDQYVTKRKNAKRRGVFCFRIFTVPSRVFLGLPQKRSKTHENTT